MLKDDLFTKKDDDFIHSFRKPGYLADAKDNFSFSAGIPGLGNVGFSTADNSLTCDSQGNCMLKDNLA